MMGPLVELGELSMVRYTRAVSRCRTHGCNVGTVAVVTAIR